MTDELKKEDYQEPCCPLKMNKDVFSIPVGRVLDRLDEYLSRNDYDSAKKHLDYWVREAEAGNDDRGKLSILNEQIGLYRKIEEKDKCLEVIETALNLCDEIGMANTITEATTLLNAATGYKSFQMAEKALPLYEKAKTIYEKNLSVDDERLGGLYNNMALSLAQLKNYTGAKELYMRAMDIMSKQDQGEAEMAITNLNLADLVYAQLGEDADEEIRRYLDAAEKLLDSDKLIHNGHYAYVCEKCAPSFGYYGYFLAEEKYSRIAKEIYERS